MNCYFFGDSFTVGLRTKNSFIKAYPKQPIPHWTEKITKRLGLVNDINHGRPGCSNEHIMKMICYVSESEEYRFAPNSTIIIGSTFSTRTPVFDDDSKNFFERGVKTIAEYHLDSKDDNKIMGKTATNYLLEYKVKYEETWEEYYGYMYRMIVNKLRLEGHRVILWHHDLWSCFESVKEATNNVSDDIHWSYRGSNDFADFVISNKDKVYLNKKIFNEYST